MATYQWKFIKHIKGCHYFWRDGLTGQLAIADESNDSPGHYSRPDETDDGVLWVDTARPIVLTQDAKERRTNFACFLTKPDGSKTQTSSSLAEVVYLVLNHGMSLCLKSGKDSICLASLTKA